MGGNSFGTIFTVTTFGESHDKGVGCVVDGCPAGLELSLEDIKKDLARRKPGGGDVTSLYDVTSLNDVVSKRREDDEPEILSGIYEGKTLGTPIAILIRNKDQRPKDYDSLKDVYRPGHADWVWEAKYGIRDHRGGGRASARETVGRVAAGAIAKVLLASYGIEIKAWTSQAAGIDSPNFGAPNFSSPKIDAPSDTLDATNSSDSSNNTFDWYEIEQNPLRMPNKAASAKAMSEIEKLKSQGDSAGCTVTCIARNLPPGLGEPVFQKLDAHIAAAMLSIGAAKGIEFGTGFAVSKLHGSQANDKPIPCKDFPSVLPPGIPAVTFESNNAGGVLGGISTGSDLIFTVAFKPVPSIPQTQETVSRNGEKTEIQIAGRHDVCIAPRVIPVVEAMCALVLADFILMQRSARVN